MAATQTQLPPLERNTSTYSSSEADSPVTSPFLDAFLTASPFAAELLSILCTPTKQNLFATCRALADYRDSCYAWQSVQLTKYGYKPQTSFAKINYQIQARLIAPARYSPLPEEFTYNSNTAVVPVEKYFCPQLDSAAVWDMFSVRPAFGTVLRELVVDGTSVDIGLITKVLAVCAVGGKGLKKLSIRYCDKIRLDDIIALLPKIEDEEEDQNSDSGFESQGESEDEDDSLLKTLTDLQLYGIRDLHLSIQDHKAWLSKIDRLLKYTAEKKLHIDVNWCSRTLSGPKKRLRRPHCHGGRDLPFVKILPLADTGSSREKHCKQCKKGPEEIGWHCDSCLKDVMCECCGTFLCDNCDPKRSHLVRCGDCPARRCKDCFVTNGGSFCKNTSCKNKATCGEHNFEIKCNHCPETKLVTCSSCNPATKCAKCSTWIYSHCDGKHAEGDAGEGVFNCDCDFQLCHGCAEDAKDKFIESNTTDGSLEEIVYAIDSQEFPIVPKRLKGLSLQDMLKNENWCCFYCRIMPRRRERFVEQKERAMKGSRMRIR